MLELSLHIMDLVQNSLAAGATRVAIRVRESSAEDRLDMEIEDNGGGIPPEMLGRITDPFVTSRKTGQAGLGLPLLREAAERCGGGIEVHSTTGAGTKVCAWFRRDHVDRAPLGDMGETLGVLIAGNPGVGLLYEHRVDEKDYRLDSLEMKKVLGPVPLDDPAVRGFIRRDVKEGLKRIGADAFPKIRRVLA